MLLVCVLYSLVCFILEIYWRYKETPIDLDNRNDTEQDLPAVVEQTREEKVIEDPPKKKRRKFNSSTFKM